MWRQADSEINLYEGKESVLATERWQIRLSHMAGNWHHDLARERRTARARRRYLTRMGLTGSSEERSSPLATASHWLRPGDFTPPSPQPNLGSQTLYHFHELPSTN